MPQKKKPSDYPQLSFRISSEDKVRIVELATQILESSNANLEKFHRRFRKNDVLVDALYLGLLTLQREGRRLYLRQE